MVYVFGFLFALPQARGQEASHYHSKIDSLFTILKTSGNRLDSTTTYIEIARGYDYLQKDSALFYAKKSLDYSLMLGSEELQYKSLSRIANYYFIRYNWEKVTPIITELDTLCAKLKKEECLASLNYGRAGMYYSKGNLERAEFYTKEAIKDFRALKNDNELVKMLHFLSGMLAESFRYDESIEILIESKEILQQRDTINYEGLSDSYRLLANLYVITKDDTNAHDSYANAINFAYKSERPKNILESLLNMSKFWLEQKEYEKALPYLQEAEKVVGGMNNHHLKALVDAAFGHYFLKTGKLDLSLSYNKSAYTQFIKKTKIDNGVFQDSMVLMDIAEAYIEKGDYDQAVVYLDELFEDASKKREPEMLSKAHYLKYTIDSVQGNYKSATDHLLAYTRIKDSLFDLKLQNKAKEFQVKYEVLQKDKEIESLRLSGQRKELRFAKNMNFIYALCIFSLLLLSIGLFMYYRYKSKSKTLELVKRQRKELNRSLSEKELLLKEIHHRVKNNLQLINSLIGIHASSLNYKDKNIGIFLEKSESRIHSMSLIHQILYESDDLNEINFKEYLEQLIASIKDSYDGHEIQYILNLENTPLNLQTSLTLGLISHEVILNSIKHAFKNNSIGKISVELRTEKNNVVLVVSDNGVGYDEKKEKTGTFGMELIHLLAEQLNASLKYGSKVGHRFALTFQPSIEPKQML